MALITLLTRVTGRTAALINNILINSYNNNHFFLQSYPTVPSYWKFKGKTCKIKNPKETIGDHKNFIGESFQGNIKGIGWSFATENDDVNLGFETFFKLFSKTLDKHAPYKEIKKKPWITKCIKKSG